MRTEYYLIKNLTRSQVIRLISDNFAIKKESTLTVTRNYYDTFDLRLKKHGFIFYRQNPDFILEKINGGSTLAPTIFRLPKEIKTWQDFPTRELQEKLKPIMYVRCLIMFAAVNEKIENYSILDKEKKIVARISLKNISVNRSAAPGTVLVLTPIRGYVEFYNAIKKVFAENHFSLLAHKGLIELIISESNVLPANYSTKLPAIDNPQMTTDKAISKLLLSLINIVGQNESGVIKNIDSEFLHDFRVALRKTRSILSLLKNVFNQNTTSSFKTETASLAKSTNKLRDYDVYLHNKDLYQSILPKHLHKGLDHFFASITRKQKHEHKKLIKKLSSASYHQFMKSWKNTINNNPEIFNDSASSLPVITLACKHIYNRFKKVLKDGRKITKESPDSDLHRLRIDCKKLRYLIEFFSGLFPYENIVVLISQLKKLQTCLGEFNDYSVQQIHFEEYLSGISSTSTNSVEMAAAIGALITISQQEKYVRRNAFFKTFKKFTHKNNIVLYKKLFIRH